MSLSKELNLVKELNPRKLSTTKMDVTKENMMKMDPEEVYDWDVENLDAGLKELKITIGTTWSKSKKARELQKAIEQPNAKEVEMPKSSDPNVLMLQVLQHMQQQMIQAEERSTSAMQAIAERVGGDSTVRNNAGAGGPNKSHAKGRHPEKLERDVDYATFLQWEKSWKLYVVSDQLDTLAEEQKTAIFFSMFSKEFLSDLEYRFKINIDADQRVEEIIEKMKTYLKGQRSMVLAKCSNIFGKILHFLTTSRIFGNFCKVFKNLENASNVKNVRKICKK